MNFFALPLKADVCVLKKLISRSFYKKAALLSVGLFLLASALPQALFAADETEELYQQAERFYLKGESENSLKTLGQFFSKTTPQNMRTEVKAHNLKGLIYFQSKNLPIALQEFESAVRISARSVPPTEQLYHLTRYNLGNAFFQNGKTNEAIEYLSSVNPETLDTETKSRFHHLFGNALAAKDQSIDAIVQYFLAANVAKDTAARDTFMLKAMTVSKKVFLKDAKGDIEKLSNLNIDAATEVGYGLKIILARGYLYSGDGEQAEKMLKSALASASPAHPLRAQAEEMLADIGKISNSTPNVVGVLLPLSGKFGRFGRLCLNSINLALGAFEEMPENPAYEKIRLVIRDSGETNESATIAFDQLVKEEKVTAVIGPLLSKQFATIAHRAQEFGVPLFSLSQKMDSSVLGSYVFPIALSPQQQIELVVKHAIENNGLKKFAVMAPSDSFGDEYLNLFWDEVEKNGGEIVGVERYEPKATDFQDETKRLLGYNDLEARRLELDDLNRREEKFAATLKVKGKLRQRILKAFDPKAVVDFDALFIPDDPATVGQIAPAFAVHDVSNLTMIGINTWNTSELVVRAGRYLQNSLFVDGFFQSGSDAKTVKFVQDYMKYFSTIPGTIEVQAYDAAKILFDTMAANRIESRSRLRNQLLATEKYDGVSGSFRFDSLGVRRGAHLLTVKGNGIVELNTVEPTDLRQQQNSQKQ